MDRGAAAFVDAAIAYGATRYLHGAHGDHPPAGDRRLFLEFLHQIVLYDNLLFNEDCIETELAELFRTVNAGTPKLVNGEALGPTGNVEPILAAVSNLVSEHLASGRQKADELAMLPVPATYRTGRHQDHEAARKAAEDAGLRDDLVPFLLFAFRGVTYSGYAYDRMQSGNATTAYVASPGRIVALSHLLSHSEVSGLGYSSRAYLDLLDELPLPPTGFAFRHLPSLAPATVSNLAAAVAEMPARKALAFTFELRARPEARALRKKWQERIWARSHAVTVGATVHQEISNSTIDGNVYQYVYQIAEAL